MSNIIEELYYGNIEPQELNALAEKEEQLTAKLTDEDKEMFIDYVNTYNEFLSLSNSDSFMAGFRLGAKFIYDTFVTD